MGLNPSTVYWMDMTIFTLICCKNCIVRLKRPKINEKEARDGPFKKKYRIGKLLNETELNQVFVVLHVFQLLIWISFVDVTLRSFNFSRIKYTFI